MRKLIPFLLPVLFFACQSVPENITYFQDIDQFKEKLMEYAPDINKFTIQEGDLLVIYVTSPDRNQELVAQFNLPSMSYMRPGETLVSQSSFVQTYNVDENGDIIFPVLGRLHVAGMTKSEVTKFLTEKIAGYIEEPVVNVQNSSYGAMVLGEVNSPGYVGARNERLTILDAIGGANGLTIYGNRENILIIRETNGVKETARLDLTKSDVFFSPYYYLQQGDVIIVDPNDTKKKTSKFGAAENYNLSIVSLTFTALSLVTSVISIIIVANQK